MGAESFNGNQQRSNFDSFQPDDIWTGPQYLDISASHYIHGYLNFVFAYPDQRFSLDM